MTDELIFSALAMITSYVSLAIMPDGRPFLGLTARSAADRAADGARSLYV